MLSETALATDISYLTVYNAHNGEFVRVPKPVRFHTLASFKTFILESFTNYVIENTENIFLLTSFGIKLNYNLINELNDVFLFDRRLFGAPGGKAIVESYIHQNEGNFSHILRPKKPIAMEPTDNIKQITSSLKVNDGWSKALLQDCYAMETQTKHFIKQINAIFKALNIVFQFGSNFISGIEKSFQSYFNYIKLLNMKTLHKSWEAHYSSLKAFPTFTLTNADPKTPIDMSALLEVSRLRSSSKYITDHLPLVVGAFNDMSTEINNVNDKKVQIDNSIDDLRNESIAAFKDYESTISTILEANATLVQTITTDLDRLSNTTPANLREIHHIHKDNYSIKMFDNSFQLYSVMHQLNDFKVRLVNESLKVFQSVADLQMKMVNVKTQLRNLTTPNTNAENKESKDVSYETVSNIKASEDYLSLTIDLPLLYGFILVEKRRQFEWSDFYSKGIVKNVSEQLSVIIDHERLFQKLWLKKFSTFVTLLNNNSSDMKILLPNLDITLVNGHSNHVSNSIFNLLGSVQIERQDIDNYIDTVKKFNISSNAKFVELLNKNFKDLIKSTENMKRVTKIVSSLGTIASPNNSALTGNSKLSSLANGKSDDVSNEVDFDVNLVKGLKTRIKKLENLLHQQQYKNITNWPVIKSPETRDLDDNKMSLIFDSRESAPKRVFTSPANLDPTHLLNRRHTTASTHDSPNLSQVPQLPPKVLDASTTIDKHLDNIRLRKEISELTSQNIKLSKIRASDEVTISDLQKQIAQLKANEVAQKQQFENMLSSKESEIEQLRISQKDEQEQVSHEKESEILLLKEQLDEKDRKISDLHNDVSKMSRLSSDTSQGMLNLHKEIAGLRVQLDDSNKMKTDLLSNLSSKESEYVKERNSLEEQIRGLKSRADEGSDDYENLMELTQAKLKHADGLIGSLNEVVVGLFCKVILLADSNYRFFVEFCYVLESMGLLLVKELNEEQNVEQYKITRVKGLRSKKGEKVLDDNETPHLGINHKLTSRVIEDVNSSMKWVSELRNVSSLGSSGVRSISTSDGEKPFESGEDEIFNRTSKQSLSIMEAYEEVFNNDTDRSAVTRFDKFLNMISFQDYAQLPVSEHEGVAEHRFFLNAISKRFNDVEGFAKRLTKENKAKVTEMNKLVKQTSNKVAVNNFQVGDLVLFLPTRIDRGEDDAVHELELQSWTAFNIGAPHYFLRISKLNTDSGAKHVPDLRNKDWTVGKIKDITESKVTSENVKDEHANPFQLSVGITWYMVDAVDEGV